MVDRGAGGAGPRGGRDGCAPGGRQEPGHPVSASTPHSARSRGQARQPGQRRSTRCARRDRRGPQGPRSAGTSGRAHADPSGPSGRRRGRAGTTARPRGAGGPSGERGLVTGSGARPLVGSATRRRHHRQPAHASLRRPAAGRAARDGRRHGETRARRRAGCGAGSSARAELATDADRCSSRRRGVVVTGGVARAGGDLVGRGAGGGRIGLALAPSSTGRPLPAQAPGAHGASAQRSASTSASPAGVRRANGANAAEGCAPDGRRARRPGGAAAGARRARIASPRRWAPAPDGAGARGGDDPVGLRGGRGGRDERPPRRGREPTATGSLDVGSDPASRTASTTSGELPGARPAGRPGAGDGECARGRERGLRHARGT